jgi:hypothetical protein
VITEINKTCQQFVIVVRAIESREIALFARQFIECDERELVLLAEMLNLLLVDD